VECASPDMTIRIIYPRFCVLVVMHFANFAVRNKRPKTKKGMRLVLNVAPDLRLP
jgi:hypothetical protein